MESYTLPFMRSGFARGLMSLDAQGIRILSLLTAISVYAVFGSPTPNDPGWAEIITGSFLLCAVGFGSGRQAVAVSFLRYEDLWRSSGKIFLLYGLSMPLLMAAMSGHGSGQVLRDIIPFLFLLLPVFLAGHFERRPDHVMYLQMAVIILGLVFSLRSLLPFYPFSLLSVGLFPDSQELFYFANAPTVLFAALVLLGLGGKNILHVSGIKDFVAALVLLSLAILPLLAMAASEQRAGLGAVLFYSIALLFLAMWRMPVKSLRLFALMLLVFWAGFPIFAETTEILSRKTSLVGMNMRTQEAKAVWDTISGTPGHMMFGLGWGGGFNSPAVGGVYVNFTHSLLTSLLLKTGLTGVFLGCLYLAALLNMLARLILRAPILGLALTAPVLVDIFLYASFKSLDFGLVLLLIPLYQSYFKILGEPGKHA